MYTFLKVKPFLSYRLWSIYTEVVFVNIVTKGEIAHNKQLFRLTKCNHLLSIIIIISKEDFNIFSYMFPKETAGDLLYVWKG